MDVDTALTPRERKLLEGFISPATMWFRAGSFAILIMLFVAFVQFMMHWLLKELFLPYHPLILLVLTLGFAIMLYRLGGSWTGGRAFRAKIRNDLLDGHAKIEVHEVSKAIEVEASEGKAPAYFLLLADKRILFIHGRENLLWKMRGFPWKRFCIRTAPNSGRFLGLQALDEPLKKVHQRPPLNIHEQVHFPTAYGCHFVEEDFEALKKPGNP